MARGQWKAQKLECGGLVKGLFVSLRWIRITQSSRQRDPVNICSDSQAAIKALAKPVTKSRLVKRVKGSLGRIAANNRVTLYWIPGHSRYKGNEKANETAKQGAAEHGLNVKQEVGIPYCTGIKSINGKLDGITFHNWTYMGSCRWYKGIMGKDLQNWTKDIWNLSKMETQKVMAFLTGHNNLKCYLYKVCLVNDHNCRWCGKEKKTPYHVICSCQCQSAVRFNIHGEITLESGEIKKGNLKSILRFCAMAGIKALFISEKGF